MSDEAAESSIKDLPEDKSDSCIGNEDHEKTSEEENTPDDESEDEWDDEIDWRYEYLKKFYNEVERQCNVNATIYGAQVQKVGILFAFTSICFVQLLLFYYSESFDSFTGIKSYTYALALMCAFASSVIGIFSLIWESYKPPLLGVDLIDMHWTIPSDSEDEVNREAIIRMGADEIDGAEVMRKACERINRLSFWMAITILISFICVAISYLW